MAILTTTPTPPPPPPSHPPPTPPLFLRTLHPSTQTSHALPLRLHPPHTHLLTTHKTHLSIHTLHIPTFSLHHLSTLPLLSLPLATSSVNTPHPHRDLVVLLSDPATITFLHYDPLLHTLQPAGHVTLPKPTSPQDKPRLLATHAQRRIVAVAALCSDIQVFPVLYLPKSVSAGKIATASAPGVILSLDFIEDDGSPGSDALLLALVQRPKEQLLALYAVRDSGGALSLEPVACMITCAAHPDDAAVARATSKLTGEAVRPPPLATAVSRLKGCAYLFAVLVRGKIIVGDVRGVLNGAGDLRVEDRMQEEFSMDEMIEGYDERVCTPDRRVSEVRRVVGESLSYLYVPEYVTLDVGEGNGFATAWCHGEGGMYVVMESGAMFMLKWGEGGFKIVGEERGFEVQFVGDVGAASAVAEVGGGIFVGNECADGSLRRVHWSGGRFGLEVRQEFVNLAPVSDFVVGDGSVVACCGMGNLGSVRVLEPGAPVSVFARGAGFKACNDMWPVRFARDAIYDAALVLTFAQGTGVLFSAPLRGGVAELLDGTMACGLFSHCRSVAVGLLEDGVLAQIHENGVRVVFLKTIDDVPFQRAVKDGVVVEDLFHATLDWAPSDGGLVSVGTIGAGFAIVCVARKARKPLLCLLKLYPGDPRRGIFVVSQVELQHELSSICIPEWTTVHSDSDFASPRLPPMAVLATYAPSVEVRLLGPTMELVDRKATFPWTLEPPDAKENGESASGQVDSNASTEQLIEYSKARNRSMTAVPQSLCAVEVERRRMVFAGLRDGSVLSFSFAEPEAGDAPASEAGSPSAAGHLVVEAHRKLGHRPVMLKVATVAFGRVILAQTERPWICTSSGPRRLRWIPLAFPETRALCSYSVLGAERCFAIVGADDVLQICGLRRKSEVSVRSIHVGATPRRVVKVSQPEDCVVVATGREYGQEGPGQRSMDGYGAGNVHAELRIYNTKLGVSMGYMTLLPGEQVHVLLEWLGFVVVGTSCDLRSSQSSGVHKICKRGRLLLYSLRSKPPAVGSSGKGSGRTRFSLCSEVVLPGAVLAGAAHPTTNMLFVSCNEQVIAFGVPRNKSLLVEIARVSVRSLVVSISVLQDVICIVDRKDSVGFFTLDATQHRLERDRSDHRRRIVSDAVLVDRTLAVAVDRQGVFFSVGYEEGDTPRMAPIEPVEKWISALLEQSGTLESLMGAGSSSGLSGVGPSENLGEEFDVMQAESGSENTNDSNEQGAMGETSAEEAVEASVNDSLASQDDGASGTTQNGGAPNGAGGEDTQEAGTNTANQTQTTEEGTGGPPEQLNVPGINNPPFLPNLAANQPDAQGTNVRGEATPVPRNLMCHHSFNLNDTALRVRVGSFNRRERALELEQRRRDAVGESADRQDVFFHNATAGVFCATLGGAVVAAVHMTPEAYALLSRVEVQLGVHPDITGLALGSSHVRFRGAFDERAMGTVDGDLLDHFDTLSRASKRDIAAKAGCPGEKGVLHIEALIRDLFDRVS